MKQIQESHFTNVDIAVMSHKNLDWWNGFFSSFSSYKPHTAFCVLKFNLLSCRFLTLFEVIKYILIPCEQRFLSGMAFSEAECNLGEGKHETLLASGLHHKSYVGRSSGLAGP